MRKFLSDRNGNYALMTAVALVPLMGGLAIAVDYAEMNRQQSAMLNALDAAGIATARQIVTGASDEALIAYANDFFHANLDDVAPEDTELTVTLPSNQAGGGTLKLAAMLHYKPHFFPAFKELINNTTSGDLLLGADTEIRLKNTLEVALVLDNSGSMSYLGSGSGSKRIDLLKTAAKELVSTLALQANMLKQIDRPVQFSLVPFAASVNVGPQYANASWMDVDGLSPVHHENFDWSTLNAPDKYAEKVNGIWRKKGTGWGEDENGVLNRFSLYRDMKMVSSREWVVTGQEYVCTSYRSNGTCRNGYWRQTGYYEETISDYASWQGCVEARPYPYDASDAPASGGSNNTGVGIGDPATMFVPMFAPDEPGDRWATDADSTPDSFSASNNWWNDGTESSSASTRQRSMGKYFDVRPFGATSPQGSGPNYSCTTVPITPLTDVSQEEGLTAIKAAIDAMAPNGATNVPEGLAWGWRTISSSEPFAQGRSESERGNDKVVIVLTDGQNTYYTPSSLGYSDPAGSKSTYSAYGYLQPGYDGTGEGRLFMGTSGAIGRYDYTNANYTKALNEHVASLCANVKAANVLVMTIALDLNAGNAGEAEQIAALKACASDSRFRKDPTDPTKPAKLFWNATGATLSNDFKEIGNELSNLRIVG